jgi:FkbM family methyltransferase
LANLVCPKGGKVIAFEPTVWALKKLKKNLALNPALNSGGVIVEHALLVDTTEFRIATTPIYSGWPLNRKIVDSLHPIHWGHSHDIGYAKKIKLDEYVSELSPSNISLIKIDVDGHEPEVIRGSWMTIKKF